MTRTIIIQEIGDTIIYFTIHSYTSYITLHASSCKRFSSSCCCPTFDFQFLFILLLKKKSPPTDRTKLRTTMIVLVLNRKVFGIRFVGVYLARLGTQIFTFVFLVTTQAGGENKAFNGEAFWKESWKTSVRKRLRSFVRSSVW